MKLIDEGVISGKIAKDSFRRHGRNSKPAKEIVEKKGLVQVSDSSAIESVVQEVLDASLQQVEQYKSGKDQGVRVFSWARS